MCSVEHVIEKGHLSCDTIWTYLIMLYETTSNTLDQPHSVSLTSSLAQLPLVLGMPVILTQNNAIELDLTNGMNGIFRQLVYQIDYVSINIISEVFPNNTQCAHRPLYALIETVKLKVECNLEQLQPKLIPIPVVEQTFRVDISDMSQKDKKVKSNRQAILSIKQRSLLLVPAYSIIAHKSQGQTLNKVVIDLKLPNETDDIAAVYVPLSRAKRLADLVILRYFDYKV